MRITTRGRYGLRAVLKLTVSDRGKPISIRELSESEDISPEFLEQIFFKLRKAGIIKSTRGPGGGFQLDKSPDQITVKDIFDAVGEEISLTPCTSDTDPRSPCERAGDCITRDMWQATSEHINEYFDNITIQSLLDRQGEPAVTNP
ncbi:MAG: Rrf2 family transcriptional regulator [Spirochaetales bacterium]|nr:Rrf2 family transcriptional regulator [Spirochaetales bacterium]